MRRVIIVFQLILLLAAISVTVSAKDKNQYPQVVLTLNDSSVINGYLRSNLHNIGKKLSVSETAEGKKISYKLEDIASLKVFYSDGDSITYRPIYVWEGFRRKVSKTPVLSSICYSSDNITCYKVPGLYVQSTAPVPSNYFQGQSSSKTAWIFYKKIRSESDVIKLMYTYIPSKKTPKLKSILKDVKNNFEKENFEYIKATVESQGITAEQIINKPWILLEILDNRVK